MLPPAKVPLVTPRLALRVPEPVLAAGGFNHGAVIFVFKVLHTIDCVLFCAGKQRRGLAELGPGLQSAPRDLVRNEFFRRFCDFALAKLPPNLAAASGSMG